MQQNDLSKAIARSRRKAPHPAEDLLWQALRNRRFLGLKVRRQVPLAGQIVDFYIADKGLAIELEPSSRQSGQILSARSFRLLRLDPQSVGADLPGSLARIAAACRQRIDPPDPI
ncbi:MAG: endonuclease domain-containing protein [Tabrizicola sp.]|jgi:very-short-patch-repair endonuclease|nr:endonuclease domain-containing protein [Tabrizicola sp.]